MKLFTHLFLAGSCLLAAPAFAQSFKTITAGKAGMFPADVTYEKATTSVSHKGSLQLPDQNGNVLTLSGLLLRQQETDALGIEHIRYQQTYLGLLVEHAFEVLHARAGALISQNGKLVQSFDRSLTATPAISEATALQAALSSVQAQVYKWQLPDEEAFIKAEQHSSAATFFPKAALVFYSGETEVIPQAMRLAYRFDIYAQQPLSRKIVFIDALTAALLGTRDLIHETNAVGTAQTAYSGAKSVTTDKMPVGNYRLQETSRGNGIKTMNLKQGTAYYYATDFTDEDNNWNNVNAEKDQYATDAHWGAEMTYDYFKTRYNRNSIDNAGMSINSYVHFYTNYFNAFWDGARMVYGDGDGIDQYRPLTSLDVCGHEISHGLTSYTSQLSYMGESGALNEGFSDVFGTAIEFYARPENANWLIGSDFYLIRSMSNPNLRGQPDTYQGSYWYTGSDDNGGVHTNSGVLNYWFYLLSVGGSGTNDKGTAFSVAGLGIDKAAAIAYRLNTVYLVSTANYAAARNYGIKAAEDLYGIGSVEAAQTANAWTAVGVAGASPSLPGCLDNYESNETMLAAKDIPVNVAVTAKISTPTDKDYFTFATTNSAPKLLVTLNNLPADYNIKMYNSAGACISTSQMGGTAAEIMKYNKATAGGTYYLFVSSATGIYNANSCYTLTVATSGSNYYVTGTGTEDDGSSAAAEAGKGFTLAPVPAVSYTNLEFSSVVAGKAKVVVTDMAGSTVKNISIGVVSGANRYRLDVSGMPNGTYLVRLEEGPGAVKVQKLMVQH